MKQILIFILIIWFTDLKVVHCQPFQLRLDMGLLASTSSQVGFYNVPRHLALNGGFQFHYVISEKNSFSVGTYLMQMKSYHAYPHPGWFSQTRNYTAIPILWHRSFGRQKRWELSMGVFASFFINGTQIYHDIDNNQYDIIPAKPRHSTRIIGYSFGFQYAFIKTETLNFSLSYRSFGQIHGFNQPRSLGTPPIPVFFSSFFSLNCGMLLFNKNESHNFH